MIRKTCTLSLLQAIRHDSFTGSVHPLDLSQNRRLLSRARHVKSRREYRSGYEIFRSAARTAPESSLRSIRCRTRPKSSLPRSRPASPFSAPKKACKVSSHSRRWAWASAALVLGARGLVPSVTHILFGGSESRCSSANREQSIPSLLTGFDSRIWHQVEPPHRVGSDAVRRP